MHASDRAFEALTSDEYDRRANAVFAAIEKQIDAWLDADVIDIDGRRTGGMLELDFPSGETIVVNTQPPLQELWLAARSGGHHFKPSAGGWADTRDGRGFFEVLSACASDAAGTPIRFVP